MAHINFNGVQIIARHLVFRRCMTHDRPHSSAIWIRHSDERVHLQPSTIVTDKIYLLGLKSNSCRLMILNFSKQKTCRDVSHHFWDSSAEEPLRTPMWKSFNQFLASLEWPFFSKASVAFFPLQDEEQNARV